MNPKTNLDSLSILKQRFDKSFNLESKKSSVYFELSCNFYAYSSGIGILNKLKYLIQRVEDLQNRSEEEIQSEIFSNKERIKQLVEKLRVLKELRGEKK